MSDPIGPLVPAGSDVAWSLVIAAALVLLVTALVSIGRRSKRLTASQALLWTLLAILLPVIGPIAWLVVGRRAASPSAELHRPAQ